MPPCPPISAAGRRIESGWPHVVQNLGPGGVFDALWRQRRWAAIVDGRAMWWIIEASRTVERRMPFVLFMVVGPALLRAV